MRCPKCGKENPAEANFCMACSTELVLPAEEAPLSLISSSSGFVGRQREMGELRTLLEEAITGRGRIVMLVGEPGIGKSRTAQELAYHAELLGARVLWGWCFEEDGAPPYWPWVQPIKSYVKESDQGQLQSQMGSGGAAVIAEVVPEIRDYILGLELPPIVDSPEQARFRLFDAVATFLENAAVESPIVLVLDDLHWADTSSLLMLQFVARQISDSRLLIVGCYRDVELSRQSPLTESLWALTRLDAFRSQGGVFSSSSSRVRNHIEPKCQPKELSCLEKGYVSAATVMQGE